MNITRIWILHLRKHTQGQGQSLRRDVTTMPWSRFKAIGCFGKLLKLSILSNISCWKLTQRSHCVVFFFFCANWNILCSLLNCNIVSILFHFSKAFFFFLKTFPICISFRRYIIPTLSYNTHSINNKLLWNKMAFNFLINMINIRAQSISKSLIQFTNSTVSQLWGKTK